MRSTHSVQDLISNVLAESADRQDYIIDTQGAAFTLAKPHPEVDESRLFFQFSEGKFTPNDNFHRQVHQSLQIGGKYYHKMLSDAPMLLCQNVNHWLTHAPKKRMIRTLSGTARAMLSTAYRRIDNIDVIQKAIMPALSDFTGLQYEGLGLTEDYMNFKIFWPGSEREVKAGDALWAGVQIKNSEVGKGSLSVTPITMRLVCTNGMTHAEFGARYTHRTITQEADPARQFLLDSTLKKEDEVFLEGVRDVVSGCLRGQWMREVVGQAQFAADLEISAPVEATESLQNDFDLTDSEKQNILNAFTQDGDRSAWGLCNAVTNIANEHPSYDRAIALEGMGGQLLANKGKLYGLSQLSVAAL